VKLLLLLLLIISQIINLIICEIISINHYY